MNSPETNNQRSNVIDINRSEHRYNNATKIAREVGVLLESNPKRQGADETEPGRQRAHERGRAKEIMMSIGVVAAAAFLLLPRVQGEMPVPEKSFLEHAQDQARIPLGESDEIVIDGIRIKPNNPRKNTASEAILGNKDVQAFMEANPREKSGIEQSALVAPTSSEYAIVKRDIDDDGELDAIAVPVESRD